jgi:hypothetical protein
MNLMPTRSAFVAALALTGLSAHAGCVDPTASTQQGASRQASQLYLRRPTQGNYLERASDRIVGTWLVTYTGGLSGQAFIQWHNDGTEWENIDYPILGGTLCMGSWKAVDSWHVARYHVGWLYKDGVLVGHFTETETDEVASDGNSYRGTNVINIYGLDGVKQAEIPGSAVATRIPPP